MLAPPPGRFSVTTVAPLILPTCSPSSRAKISALPPAGNGTTMRMVRPACDQLLSTDIPTQVTMSAAAAAVTTAARRLIMRFPRKHGRERRALRFIVCDRVQPDKQRFGLIDGGKLIL